jgi:hypothetical protein
MVDYDFREPKGWALGVASFQQQERDDGATVVLSGNCPRCGDAMDVELPVKAQTGSLTVSVAAPTCGAGVGGFLSLGRKLRPFTKTARCNCGTKHANRPDDVHDGCGAFGNLTVKE